MTDKDSKTEPIADAMDSPTEPLREDTDVNPVDQTLVAYLDGELTETETEEIESRLANDEPLRNRLHELQAAWDMLDELPHSEPDRGFVKSTIEMVVTASKRKKARWHRWPLRIAGVAVAFVLAAAVAFQVVRSIQNQPYREFVTDLDFLENVDMYDSVGSLEFLEELHAEGLFAAQEDLSNEP